MAPGVQAAAPALSYIHRKRTCRCRASAGPPASPHSAGPLPSSPLLLPAVALDVEFGHWRRTNGSGAREVAVAAWVAVVDEQGKVLLDSRIQQRCQLPPEEGDTPWCHWGGVQWDQAAPQAAPRADVLHTLLPILEGHLVVGHGIAQDAEALGLGVEPIGPAGPWRDLPQGFMKLTCPRPQATATPDPFHAMVAYDTKAFSGFQGRSGVARSLSRLAHEHLGRRIQQKGPPSKQQRNQQGRPRSRPGSHLSAPHQAAPPSPTLHDAVEDAAAVAELYVKVARPRLLLDTAAAGGGSGSSAADAFDRLVELQTRALLEGAAEGNRQV